MIRNKKEFADDIDYLVEQFARGSENRELSYIEKQETLTGVLYQITKVAATCPEIHTYAGKAFAYGAIDRCIQHISEQYPGLDDLKGDAYSARVNISYAAHFGVTYG